MSRSFLRRTFCESMFRASHVPHPEQETMDAGHRDAEENLKAWTVLNARAYEDVADSSAWRSLERQTRSTGPSRRTSPCCGSSSMVRRTARRTSDATCAATSSGRTVRSSTSCRTSRQSWLSSVESSSTATNLPATSSKLLRERVTSRFADASELRQRMIRAAEAPAPEADVGVGATVEAPRPRWKTQRRVEAASARSSTSRSRGAQPCVGPGRGRDGPTSRAASADRRGGGGARRKGTSRFGAGRGRPGLRRPVVHP